MKLKNVFPIMAMLVILFMAGCQKDTELLSQDSDLTLKRGKIPPELVVKAVNLRHAADFVILSNSGITDVSSSAINGNIGTYFTGASITATDGNICDEVTGKIYTIDATGPACRHIDAARLLTASLDMETAYTDAAGRPTSLGLLDVGAGNIGGLTLTPGVYTWGTGVTLPANTNVTLSGKKDAVWIFQVAQTLTTFENTQIILTGGANAKNIFWVVGETVALADQFQGNILGKTDITLTVGATITGRLLAGTNVTLIQNGVTKPR